MIAIARWWLRENQERRPPLPESCYVQMESEELVPYEIKSQSLVHVQRATCHQILRCIVELRTAEIVFIILPMDTTVRCSAFVESSIFPHFGLE